MNRKIIRLAFIAGSSLAVLAGSALSPSAAAAQGTVCQGFAKDQQVRRLGSSQRFSKKPAETWEDLTRFFEKERAAIEAILVERGLGETVEGFFERVSTGQISETTLTKGDTLEWMILRDHGQPATKGPLCFNTRQDYEAFVVKVPVVTMTEAAAANCWISATGDCRAHTLGVDASSSSPGVSVTMNGSRISLDSQAKWSGSFDNRFDQSYQFVASAQTTGTKITKTYTFVIPKICLNLSLLGPPKVAEEKVAGKSCTETATVNACPKPECSITGPDQVKKRDTFDVTIDGNGEVTLEVLDPKGNTESLSTGAADSFTASNKFRKRGDYVFSGTVTTQYGDTAKCEKTVTVGRKRSGASAGGAAALAGGGSWILRFFGAGFSTDEEIRTDSGAVNGVTERTKLTSGSGAGVGIGAEYLFNDRVGIEGSLIYGQVGFDFQRDLNNDWALDDDDAGILTLTVGPNFHLTPNGAVDLYLGPFVGLAEVDDAEFRTLGSNQTFNFDSEFIWGAQIGLDVPFGSSPWGFHVGGRFMDLSVGDNGPRTPELQLDPLIFTAGFAYRF